MFPIIYAGSSASHFKPSSSEKRTFLLWQTNPVQQIGEARIGADVVESRVNININNSPSSEFLFQSGKCSVFFAHFA